MGWIEWFNNDSINFHCLKGKTILFTWAQGGQGDSKGYARPWNSIQESLLIASRFGLNIILARPDGYDLDSQVYQWVNENCKNNNTSFKIIDDNLDGYEGVDIVYSRNWASANAYQNGSFQRESEFQKASLHTNWITTAEKMSCTNNAIFTHPMPVVRNSEVTDEVASSKNSVIYKVAQNRLYTQQAMLSLLIS
jgi:N-acetylornithine carbamoyltransferase